MKQLFENPITEVYLMFFQAILPAFTTLNKFLHRDAPCLYLLHDCMQSFVSNNYYGKVYHRLVSSERQKKVVTPRPRTV